MKLQDIPQHLNITAAQLAEMAGIKKQSLNQYTTGARGKPSTVIRNVCAVAGLNREEVFFPDPFDHPFANDRENPAYWLSLSIEALKEAKKRGAIIDGLIPDIMEVGKRHLPEFGPEIFDPKN